MQIVPLSALRDNYIWAICEGTRCVLVDPGEAAPAQTFLDAHGLSLAAILLTHRHADHQGGVAELLSSQTVSVYGPASAAMPQVSHVVAEQDELRFEGFATTLRVLAIPGHTEEHIAYHWNDALFCGDTLFGGGCGRLMGGTATQFHASLQRLAALPPETMVYCAHEYTCANLAFSAAVEPGNPSIQARRSVCETLRAAGHPTLPSRLQEELTTNPFLRCAEPAVIAAAEKQAGYALPGPLEVFTELRKWKDGF